MHFIPKSLLTIFGSAVTSLGYMAYVHPHTMKTPEAELEELGYTPKELGVLEADLKKIRVYRPDNILDRAHIYLVGFWDNTHKRYIVQSHHSRGMEYTKELRLSKHKTNAMMMGQYHMRKTSYILPMHRDRTIQSIASEWLNIPEEYLSDLDVSYEDFAALVMTHEIAHKNHNRTGRNTSSNANSCEEIVAEKFIRDLSQNAPDNIKKAKEFYIHLRGATHLYGAASNNGSPFHKTRLAFESAFNAQSLDGTCYDYTRKDGDFIDVNWRANYWAERILKRASKDNETPLMNGGLSAYHILKDALKNPESHYQFDKNAQLIAQYYIDAIDYFVKPDIILRAKTQKIPRLTSAQELQFQASPTPE